MSFTESGEHKELRATLRELEDKFRPSKADQRERTDQFDSSCLQKEMFFTACPASLLLNPDVEYDRKKGSTYPEFKSTDPIHRRPIDCANNLIAYLSSYITANDIGSETKFSATSWSSISLSEGPFRNLDEYEHPEFGVTSAIGVRNFSHPHVKAMIYNGLEGRDGQLLRGEITLALRIIRAQARWRRLFEHMTVPVLLFSFMGPQHARIVEAYFDGEWLVMRPTRLFDLRDKNETLIKCFGQWYFGEPIGETREPLQS
ncbi:hypothetical protein BDV25DRAFT_159179 [Aspergillus avenaceus]|uniref:Fungal-type protein kinase domain-containing protein n=1 Tax=Aspergillus avenaceus TaxID=36643 RepID=A0A5N6TNT0_ASPAV|nr:hypothetical protein BDV25DRAFT_159179 [Aspergillus avenaceus]